jgi:hypothetical protein
MKSSQAISTVNVYLVYDVSETVSLPPSSGVHVMSVGLAGYVYICKESCRPFQPGPRGEQWGEPNERIYSLKQGKHIIKY